MKKLKVKELLQKLHIPIIHTVVTIHLKSSLACLPIEQQSFFCDLPNLFMSHNLSIPPISPFTSMSPPTQFPYFPPFPLAPIFPYPSITSLRTKVTKIQSALVTSTQYLSPRLFVVFICCKYWP